MNAYKRRFICIHFHIWMHSKFSLYAFKLKHCSFVAKMRSEDACLFWEGEGKYSSNFDLYRPLRNGWYIHT